MTTRIAAARTLGLALWLGAHGGLAAPADPSATSAGGGSVLLFVDGTFAGTCLQLEGGQERAEPVAAATSASAVHPDLQLTRVTTAPVVLRLAQLSPPLVQWLQEALDRPSTLHALRLAAVGADGATAWDLTAATASLRALSFEPPAATAPTSGPGTGVVSSAWTVVVTFAAGGWTEGKPPLPTTSATSGAIRFQGPIALTLDGLPTAVPASFGPVAISLGLPAWGAGQPASPTTIAPLSLTLRAAQAAPWATWARGGLRSGKAVEKAGTLTWQGSGAALQLKNVGANALGWGLSDALGPTATLALYVEDLELAAGTTTSSGARDAGLPVLVGGLGLRRVGPFEVTVSGVETLASPLLVAEERLTPTPRERLVRINYTLRNLGAEPERIDSGTLSFQVVDTTGAAFGTFLVASGTELARLTGLTLAGGESLAFAAVGTIATRPVSTVRITCASDGTSTTYRVP